MCMNVSTALSHNRVHCANEHASLTVHDENEDLTQEYLESPSHAGRGVFIGMVSGTILWVGILALIGVIKL